MCPDDQYKHICQTKRGNCCDAYRMREGPRKYNLMEGSSLNSFQYWDSHLESVTGEC